MSKDTEMNGQCVFCGQRMCLECIHCYCILEYEFQLHTCTDPEKEPGIIKPQLCDFCEDTVIFIFCVTFVLSSLSELYRKSIIND